jgi:dethiobiotin synthetase
VKLIITGTDTGVGKTFFTLLLGKFLQTKKIEFVVCKPFASGTIKVGHQKVIEDIYYYQKYLNLTLNKNLFVYKTFKFPNAPTIASYFDKKIISEKDFTKCVHFVQNILQKHSTVLIEGIGGLLVPITPQKLFIDLIKKLKLPVILITTNRLGTINHTLLSINILRQLKMEYFVVFNQIDPKKSQKENNLILQEIKKFGKIKNIYTIPYFPSEK